MDTLDTGDYHGHMEQQDGFVKNGKIVQLLPDPKIVSTRHCPFQANSK